MVKSILMIGGASNTGKTTTTEFIAKELINKGYNLLKSQATGDPKKDTLYLFQGNDNEGKTVNIVVNTPSDDKWSANDLDSFLQNASCDIDIIITAIRSCGTERTVFLNVLNKYKAKGCVELEVHLAEVALKNQNSYIQCIENLSKHILRSYPFDLKI